MLWGIQPNHTKEVKFEYLNKKPLNNLNPSGWTHFDWSVLKTKSDVACSRRENGAGLQQQKKKKKSSAAEHVKPCPATIYLALLFSSFYCGVKAPPSDTDSVGWRERSAAVNMLHCKLGFLFCNAALGGSSTIFPNMPRLSLCVLRRPWAIQH